MAEPAVEQGAADATCAGSGGGDGREQPAAAEVAAEAPAPEQEAEEAAVAPEEELAAARGGDGGGACGRPRWRNREPAARGMRARSSKRDDDVRRHRRVSTTSPLPVFGGLCGAAAGLCLSGCFSRGIVVYIDLFSLIYLFREG